MYDIRDKKVLIVGAGKSGIGSARLFLKMGANVVLYDGNEKLNEDDIRGSIVDIVPPKEAESFKVVLGQLSDDIFENLELAVFSPGVPLDCPDALRIKAAGIKIIGELEAAAAFSKGDILAITGTNGKTTTTTLLGEIMKRHVSDIEARKGSIDVPFKDQVVVAGNIGEAFTEKALSTTDSTISVLEVSSFQLETIESFHPKISAILNITPDHLNRHHTMENYIACKERICENQGKDDTVVLNFDDPVLREFGLNSKNRVFFFSKSETVKNLDTKGRDVDFIYLKGDKVYWQGNALFSVKDSHLLGSHNYENIMAATAMAIRYGVSLETTKKAVLSFRAVEHRIEFVRTFNGVDYYNDSKGTNPDASIKAVLAMEKPIVIICGGYDKKLSFDSFIESFEGRVKHAVLIGETAGEIEECAKRHGFDSLTRADSLEKAVKEAASHAAKGDAVLLSPANASWDMFKNYEERGRLFKEYVQSL
ncbi:MAG: UDP-N-acetylmuramoyl-L-alanine--D-glutamate ligase [Lachnospiraceae bacterium]|nr:UDP-N-acetylmuramoyl-L-alanine--D-glutamate ligase [Lachnospiraceae bacterium]